MNATERPSVMPLAIAVLCAVSLAAHGSFRLVGEWKLSVSEGVLLFAQMMSGPFSKAFLYPSERFTSSLPLMVTAALCLLSFAVPVVRRKQSSIYIAAAGAFVWIMSGTLVIVGAEM